MTSNAENAGTLTFNQDANTINATQYGAFNTLKAGDTLVLGNTGANNGAYVIKSISADGKTITLEDSTPLKADETAGDGVTFSTSYPIGSVIEMDGFDKNIATQVQVTGISDDGNHPLHYGGPQPSAGNGNNGSGIQQVEHEFGIIL
ncbi:MAG: hypothetical protein ACLU99_04910 [Alphaproteobacteria bacterium]